MHDPKHRHRALVIAERVARACIPELAGRPLYMLQPSPKSMIAPQDVGSPGLYLANLDLAAQPELEAQGRWKGRGVGIIVDSAWAYSVSQNDDEGARKVLGVALHEMAHFLDLPESAVAPADPYAVFKKSRAIREQRAQEPREFTDAYLGHDHPFIRLCSHLWYRARTVGGFAVPEPCIRFGNQYPTLERLHSPVAYIDALYPELQACVSMPLREVSKLETTKEFTKLCRLDLYNMFVAKQAA